MSVNISPKITGSKPEAVQQLDGLFLMRVKQMGFAHHYGHCLMPRDLNLGTLAKIARHAFS